MRRVALILVTCLFTTALAAQSEKAAFRIRSMFLRDPHIFLRPHGCADLAVNLQINEQLNSDGDGDGYYDLSPVVLFTEYDPEAFATALELVFARCTIPSQSPTVCSGAGAVRFPAEATNHRVGECLGVIPGTTNPAYPESIHTPADGCFVSEPRTIVISLVGASVTLHDARIGAVYEPADTGLQKGLIRGFVTEEDAENTALPHPMAGAKNLAALLPGGTKNCAKHSDIDIDPAGRRGWYFYFDFTAVREEYKDDDEPR